MIKHRKGKMAKGASLHKAYPQPEQHSMGEPPMPATQDHWGATSPGANLGPGDNMGPDQNLQ